MPSQTAHINHALSQKLDLHLKRYGNVLGTWKMCAVYTLKITNSILHWLYTVVLTVNLRRSFTTKARS